jgi:hypothetical protein
VNFAVWVPMLALVVLFSVLLLAHLVTHNVPYMPKWAWALMIVVTMPLGGVVYLLVVVMGAGVQRPDAEGRATD